VHLLIGGAWGEGSLFDDEDIEFARMPDKLLFFKVLWRMGYTRCPETCTLGAPCKCAVPQEYIDTYGAETLLTNTNIIYGLASDLVDADDELYLKVLRAVEDPGIAGEMFSSAAAFDPSFWPLHGAAERLVDQRTVRLGAHLGVKGEVLAALDLLHPVEGEVELGARLHQPLLRVVDGPLHRDVLGRLFTGDAALAQLVEPRLAVSLHGLAVCNFLLALPRELLRRALDAVEAGPVRARVEGVPRLRLEVLHLEDELVGRGHAGTLAGC
jgi:hypothetical protein